MPEVGMLPFQVDTGLHTGRLIDAGFEDVEGEILRSDYRLGTDAVVALYATLAVLLRRPQCDQQRILEELANLVEDEFDGVVERRFVTAIYVGTKPAIETS